MGFETFEYHIVVEKFVDLKYPYGIWNLRILMYWSLKAGKFEVSLWDLKQEFENFGKTEGRNLKYPYGIWNFLKTERCINTTNLKYPYGIWNYVTHN